MRRLPSLRALQAFEATARLGRMTLAAEELGVTHGAVSRQIRHLEDELQVALFEGPKNALRPSEAGRALQSHLSVAFDRMVAGVRAVAAQEDSVLDVSCLSTLAMRWLIPRLHRFAAEHPMPEIRLTTSDAPVDFGRERYDVAIRVTDHDLPAEAEVTDLFAEQVGPVVARELAAARSFATPEDLLQVPLLQTRTRRHAWARWAADVGWARQHFEGPEYEHFYFMLEAAAAGIGAGIAPWPLVVEDIRSGRLVAPFGFRASGQRYVAVRRRRRHGLASLFVDWLKSEAQSAADSG